VILPILVVSELIYWAESNYVESSFHVPAPVIALMIAATIAILATNIVDLPAKYWDGLMFSTKWFLKLGIILYGLNFSYALWLKTGSEWILVVGVVAVVVPLVVGYHVGRLLGLDRDSRILVGVGTGVCGISAIVATQQALKSDDKAAGMSLATILVFGTFVLFFYPVLENILSLSTTAYGVWTGATTLDLPQLVAAALQGGGKDSLTAALWVKSIRIGLLAPVILVLVTLFNRPSGKTVENSKYRTVLSAFPLFIVVFFLGILLNTLYPIPTWILAPIATGKGEFLGLNAASVLLTTAIIGICFRVRGQVVGKSGWKILVTGGLAWGIQSLLILWLIHILPIPAI
jgi:uncharacterized integral membrane protein (TIGR00698 family)